MTHDDKKREARVDPLGELRLGFDELLSALGEAVSEISERLESGQSSEVRRSFEVDTGKGPVRAEAGMRVRFAGADVSAGKATNAKMATPVNPQRAKPSPAQNPEVPSPRPIDFEIIEDADCWRLTADIPGVEQSELALGTENGDLVIETIGKRRFRGTTVLPVGLEVADLDVSLRNGILELSGSPRQASDA